MSTESMTAAATVEQVMMMIQHAVWTVEVFVLKRWGRIQYVTFGST